MQQSIFDMATQLAGTASFVDVGANAGKATSERRDALVAMLDQMKELKARVERELAEIQ